ncbi:hypothetical protein QYE76_008463 [Lolium multiflorum]|uniref:Uncharacterized protein n=1 Tax=Lolium multiflorum TaxID=4521 RepID=A0AAD8TRB6_LOLMU|nr:hypothetical protein QYE76_008463 [Lolium multiflorum]
MENYSLLMGDSSVDGDGGGVDGGAFRGHFPVPAACRNRDSCPPDLGFAMAAALEEHSPRRSKHTITFPSSHSPRSHSTVDISPTPPNRSLTPPTPWKLAVDRSRSRAAAGTRASPSSDIVPEHTAHPSWSHGELSDPLGSPPDPRHLAGEDDGPHDLNALSDFLERPHPEFHGIQVDDTPGGELQWIITADLRGKMEPPTSERILFSFRESNWLDGLARGLQEALARLCGQNVVRILASRFAHLVRRDAMGVPMELQPHPELRHHAEHLDFMLYQTQKDLDATRAYANQTHAHIIEQGEAIKLLNNDRKSLRQQRAKKDATIVRLRAKIASLEATVKAQEDQIRELEDDDGGIDIQGGGAFLSDDDDFEEDEFTEEEDYEFLEAGPDDYIVITRI